MSGTVIELTSGDGFRFGALRVPAQGARKGGLVLVQEIFGINSYMVEACERFAAEGYEVIAPSMFDRQKKGFVTETHTPEDIAEGGGYARANGIETVYQTLAMSPALSIADNMFMGRELRKPGVMGRLFRQLDRPAMERFAREKLTELGLMTIQNINQAVETLSGGQRQGVAVARAAAFGSKVVILDEPTAALGVKESRRVLELIRDVRARGIPIILISHNMPHVFEVADRIHIHRLGRRLCVIRPGDYTMSDAVAFMTGAKEAPAEAVAA